MPPLTRNRSSLICLSILTFLLLTAVWSRTGSTAVPPPEPSRDINTYVLFAFDELNFKGRNANPSRGFIRGGNVGVNNPDPHGIGHDPYSPVLALGANGAVVMDDGSQVVGDTVRVGETSSIWNLFANEVQTSFDPSVVLDPPVTPYTGPIINPALLPTCPPFSPGTLNITVTKGGSLALAPGDYGDVRVQDNGTLTLAAGVYNLKSFNNGKKVRILTNPATDVRVAQDFSTNDGSYVGPADCARFCVRSDGVSHNDASVSFGRNTEVHGQFLVPNGRMNLGHSTDMFGRFWARSVSSDFNVNMTLACSLQNCLTVKSGNGDVGGLDAQVQFFDGSNFVSAFVVPPFILGSFSYSVIPGTHWVSVAPDRNGAMFSSFTYRTTFTLPPSYANPSLAMLLHCDNVATVFLNGNQIGAQVDQEIVQNFQDPAESFMTNNSGFFVPGLNVLTFTVRNYTDATALDFSATVCYSQFGGN